MSPNQERTTKESSFRRYGFAVAACILAGELTHFTSPVLGHTSFFEFFHIAVVVSAFYGGLGPGMLAATLSFFTLDYFVIPPAYTFILGPHLFRLAVFAAAAGLTAWLSGKLKEAKQEEVAQRRAAESEVLEVSGREQSRLGQDLHDGLCQTLAGLRLTAENLRQTAQESPPSVVEGLGRVETELTRALEQAYAISRGLYPVELETNGLLSALEELVAKIEKIYPVKCRFRCWDPIAASDHAVAMHLFRIAQEAIVNGIKGGRANRINLRLSQRWGRIVMSVADNGVGFGNAPKRKGMGMKIMEYRARAIHANLRFRSRRSGGTVVTCAVPPPQGPNGR